MMPMDLSSCELLALHSEGVFVGLLDQVPFSALLARRDWLRTFEAGSIVMHHTASGAAAVIIHGTLEVLLHNRQGDERMLRTVGGGDCVGLEAVLGELPLVYEARALTRGRLLMVPKSYWLEWVESSPLFARRLLAAMAWDTGRLYEEIDGQAKSMLQRLACYLHCGEGHKPFSGEGRDHRAGQYTVSLPYIKLAHRLGTSQPHLSRSLRRLEEAGVIERQGRHIRIKDEAGFSNLLCATCTRAQ